MNLKELRVSKGLKVKDVAAAVGVSSASVTLWESGERFISLPHVIKLANLYNVKAQKIIQAVLKTNKAE